MSEEIPFESLLKNLEVVVTKLESGELPLEESLKAYEEGIGLVRGAQSRLDSLSGKLEQLRDDGKTESMA